MKHQLSDPRKTTATLSNGLRVVVIELPHLHTGSAQLMVRVGSRYEDGPAAGLSHFVEHMIYRGSVQYPTTFELNCAIERRGGGLYAETSREITSYLLDAPPESLPGLLDVLGDALINPGWHQLDVEKKIVLEEILEDLDEDGQLVRSDDVARRQAWGDHPLGQPITGTRDSVAAFTEAAIAAHHRDAYVGANSVLCVAGPFEPEPILEAAERAFAALHPGRRLEPQPAPQHFSAPGLRFIRYPESQTTLNLVMHALSEPHPLSAAQSLLLRILDDGLSTRLYRRIVDELGLAYNVGASAEVLEDVVLVDISASCAHNSAVRLTDEVLTIGRTLAREPPSPDELEIAKRRMLWDVEASFDNPRAMVEYYGTVELLRREQTMLERAEQILAATRDELHEAARALFVPDRLALAAVGKLPKGDLAALASLLKLGVA
ncbi:MAG: pitrilysin family protein [bacterium]